MIFSMFFCFRGFFDVNGATKADELYTKVKKCITFEPQSVHEFEVPWQFSSFLQFILAPEGVKRSVLNGTVRFMKSL